MLVLSWWLIGITTKFNCYLGILQKASILLNQLDIRKKSLKHCFKMSYEQQEHQQQANPNDQQQTPWHISEANSDCLHVFEKLKLQREQCRFTDLFLIVQGRNFPAHRCVLAACSPWFDARLKVHKNIRECLELDQCKNYKIFYALLEYCLSWTSTMLVNFWTCLSFSRWTSSNPTVANI